MSVSLNGPITRKIEAMISQGWRPAEKPKPKVVDVSRRRFDELKWKIHLKPIIATPRFPMADPAPVEVRRLSISRLQRAVEQVTEIPVAEQKSARRGRPAVRARQIAMYLAKEMTPHSLSEIGRCFGDRDHTTVLHAIRKIGELIGTDPVIAARGHAVRALLQSEGF